MRKPIAGCLLTLVAAATLIGCGSDSDSESEPTSSGGTNVDAYDFRFEPTTLTVRAGAKVDLSLHNEGDAEHNFSIEEAKVDTDIEAGDDADVSFTAPADPGDYTFFCSYHRGSGMTGTLHVEGTSSSTRGADY